jgi:hypothetical protein
MTRTDWLQLTAILGGCLLAVMVTAALTFIECAPPGRSPLLPMVVD